MSQLRKNETDFESLDVDVKAVSFDSPSLGKRYANARDLSWPMLHDQERELYRAYGFSRGKLANLIGPLTTLKYIPQILGGHAGPPGKDLFQMGGNVLIDPNGIVRMHHASTGPHDRPTAEEILAVIRREPE